jgi:hypothetical protein
MHLIVSPEGRVKCLYGEAIDLKALGTIRVSRASYVEPDVNANWWANMAASEGPLLGPFTTRTQALKAEEEWLLQNRLRTDETPSPTPAPASTTS